MNIQPSDFDNLGEVDIVNNDTCRLSVRRDYGESYDDAYEVYIYYWKKKKEDVMYAGNLSNCIKMICKIIGEEWLK